MQVRRLFTTLLAMLLTVAVAVPAGAAIRFDRVRYDAPGTDTRTNSQLNREFVVLINTGDEARDLSDWRVRDRNDHVYPIPDGFVLRPGRIVRIHTGKGNDDGNDLYWNRGWYVWNNDADRALLKNRARDTVDRCAYNDGSKSENVRTKHC